MGEQNRGNENIADVVSLEPYSNHEAVREALINVIRWLGDREPVAPGDPFLKFATGGKLVSLGLVTERDILGDDDGGGVDDGGAADTPKYVYVHAREMYPSVTDGSDVLTMTEITAAKPNIQYLAFNALAASSADFQLIMPEGWPGNAFTFKIYWTHPTGAGSPTVVWRFQAHSAGDGEDIGSDFADGGMTTDTGGTGNSLYITDQSNPITISGINAKSGDLIFCRITREATDAADTLTTEARLFAMRFDLGEAQVAFQPLEAASTWDTGNTTGGPWVFSNGNKTAQYTSPPSGVGIQSVVGSVSRNAGKRYFEIELTTTLVSFGTGVRHDLGVTYDTPPIAGGSSGEGLGIGYRRGGAVFSGGSNIGAVTALTSGDVVGVAIDIDSGKVWLSFNGTYTQGDPVAGTSPEATLTSSVAYRPFFSAESLAYSTVTLRTTSAEFDTAPPSGFVSWATP